MGRPQTHLFLIGFMGAGKTTVGRLVAARLGIRFIDLDEHIEQVAGVSISELFASRGETAFRALESDCLRQLEPQPAVVATGGGAPCHDENLSLMRSRGLVIALTAPIDVLRQRLSAPGGRPLASQSWDQVQELYLARQPVYRQAHASVINHGMSPDRVAERIVDIAHAAWRIPGDLLPDSSLVALLDRSYPIIVAAGALARLGELARIALGERCERIAIVSDDNVAPLYGAAAQAALRAAGFDVSLCVVPAGESSKSFDRLAWSSAELVSAGLDRHSAIVALGGGVVGDLAGFLAAVLFRGIAYIHVPTSLLAMVDSSIGGKTGINIPAGKNLAGAFWQPSAVIADPDVLATLPVRERRAAFGELVKYGLLVGEDLYAAVDRLAPELEESGRTHGGQRAQVLARMAFVIRACAGYKGFVVARDEREQTGERALLNLGHTVGHAIEAASGYGTVLHGEAVALGLVAACRVSSRLGLCADALTQRVTNTLERARMDGNIQPWLRRDVLSHMKVDKKRTGRSIHFIAVHRVGECSRVQLEIDRLSRILLPESTV